MIDWPGNSPDLNPIENCFGIMKKKLQRIDCGTRYKVIRAVRAVWRDLDQNYFKKLAHSMPHRIQQCIDNDYGMTKY